MMTMNNSVAETRTVRVDGVFNIDKPYGMTSMEVVRRLKRASKQKRVGHGGTLDPVATGVLPICFGQATRFMEYLINSGKGYRAVVELGVKTDTYDALGTVTETSDASGVTADALQAALEPFRGTIDQVPPMFSALKQQGKRLYDLARQGIEVDREPRRVEVKTVELVEWSPPHATVEIECGRGFYMRSFAHDLGDALGCGGHLKELIRLHSGPFKLSESLTLEDAEECLTAGNIDDALFAPDIILYNLRAVVLGKQVAELIRNGRALPPGLRIPYSQPNEQVRVYTDDGRFLGVMLFDASAGHWRPEKVFSLEYIVDD